MAGTRESFCWKVTKKIRFHGHLEPWGIFSGSFMVQSYRENKILQSSLGKLAKNRLSSREP